jgi:hypothetical protein
MTVAQRKTRPAPQREVVQRVSEIPSFPSEDEEHAFWFAHALGEGLLNDTTPLAWDVLTPSRPRTWSVAVRFDEATLRRVRALPARRHRGYQPLIKQFVTEGARQGRKTQPDRRPIVMAQRALATQWQRNRYPPCSGCSELDHKCAKMGQRRPKSPSLCSE